MGRHRHHRALAVAHQHEVGDIDRHLFAGDRVARLDAGVHPLLFHRLDGRLGGLLVLALVDEGQQLRVVDRAAQRQRVLGRHRHIGDAHQGIGAGGEDLQRLVTLGQAEVHLHPFGAADPVLLHRAHLFGPALELVQVRQQLIGIGGDFHEVLRDLAALDRRIATPATAVDHLLVGQHRHVVGAPVDRRGLLVDQSLVEQLGEQPLFPAVVVGVTGGDLALPVIAETEALQLPAHVVDVLVGPLRRRHVVLDRRVLRRQAEGVPAHRLQHILAQHALVAADHIADGVVAHVAHVQPAAGVGEHGEAVELLS